MKKVRAMWEGDLDLISLGLRSFTGSMEAQGARVIHVDWTPPAGGDPRLIGILDRIRRAEVYSRIKAANDEAISRISAAQPVLVDIRPAREVIPGMDEETILHAGPPIEWERMCGPVKGAIMGALVYEGRAADLAEAEKIASSGDIRFSPCHQHGAVGPMAGVISPSMWVFVIENRGGTNTAFATLNEGLGKVLRFGAYDDEVISKLKWMEEVLAPSLAEAVRRSGGINIKGLIARALMMGDECHNRNEAATSIFLREIMPHLLSTGLSVERIKEVFDFINGNNHFFLNLSMPAAKATVDTVLGLEYSTIMCAMARNGTELGIRVAGLGERWFTAPAGEVNGLYFAGFSAEDACGDLGDSTITETAGYGGMAMAGAPAIVKFVGGRPSDALRFTREMYEITWARNRDYQIPSLDFQGTPTGVDVVKVVETGTLPFINTGIAHKDPGIGQIGAGLLRAPRECFVEAVEAFAERYA